MGTANVIDTIPGPLQDRMEIIRLSGYDLPEKVAIAKQYLIPKTRIEAGIPTKDQVEIMEKEYQEALAAREKAIADKRKKEQQEIADEESIGKKKEEEESSQFGDTVDSTF